MIPQSLHIISGTLHPNIQVCCGTAIRQTSSIMQNCIALHSRTVQLWTRTETVIQIDKKTHHCYIYF